MCRSRHSGQYVRVKTTVALSDRFQTQQPFNHAYTWDNSTQNMIIADPTISRQNTFVGSATQQATSVTTNTDAKCYEFSGGCYSVYGFEVRNTRLVHGIANV